MSAGIVWAAVILACLGFLAWLWAKAAKSGAAKVEKQILETQAKAREKQLQAAINAPQGKDEVLKRLREKGL